MDVTQFIYFKTIAECNSLTKAAQKLHISQPAMSAMLKKFEKELEVELFTRSSNQIKLNSDGEVALIYVESILRNIEQMKADLRTHSLENQSLSIAFCDPGIRWYCIPRFPSAHPEINVTSFLYNKENETRMLTRQICDLLISPYPLADSSIASHSFMQNQTYLFAAASSPYAKMTSVSLRDIEPQPFLIPDIGGYMLCQLEKIIEEENPKITLIKNDWVVTQQLLRTTNILATSSDMSRKNGLERDEPNRVLVPLSDPEQKVTYHINYLKENRKKITAFLSWVFTEPL